MRAPLRCPWGVRAGARATSDPRAAVYKRSTKPVLLVCRAQGMAAGRRQRIASVRTNRPSWSSTFGFTPGNEERVEHTRRTCRSSLEESPPRTVCLLRRLARPRQLPSICHDHLIIFEVLDDLHVRVPYLVFEPLCEWEARLHERVFPARVQPRLVGAPKHYRYPKCLAYLLRLALEVNVAQAVELREICEHFISVIDVLQERLATPTLLQLGQKRGLTVGNVNVKAVAVQKCPELSRRVLSTGAHRTQPSQTVCARWVGRRNLVCDISLAMSDSCKRLGEDLHAGSLLLRSWNSFVQQGARASQAGGVYLFLNQHSRASAPVRVCVCACVHLSARAEVRVQISHTNTQPVCRSRLKMLPVSKTCRLFLWARAHLRTAYACTEALGCDMGLH